MGCGHLWRRACTRHGLQFPHRHRAALGVGGHCPMSKHRLRADSHVFAHPYHQPKGIWLIMPIAELLTLMAIIPLLPVSLKLLTRTKKTLPLPRNRLLRNHKEQLNMASNPDLVQYIADQCAGAGEITVKKMFGDYGIYCDGIIFGLICDNRFYLKPTEAVRSLLRSVELRPPYEGAKDYFFIEDVDNRDYLSELVRKTCKALPKPKPKKK